MVILEKKLNGKRLFFVLFCFLNRLGRYYNEDVNTFAIIIFCLPVVNNNNNNMVDDSEGLVYFYANRFFYLFIFGFQTLNFPNVDTVCVFLNCYCYKSTINFFFLKVLTLSFKSFKPMSKSKINFIVKPAEYRI